MTVLIRKKQILQLSEELDVDKDELMMLWLSVKYDAIKGKDVASETMDIAEE